MIDLVPPCEGCRCATGAGPIEPAGIPFAAIVAHGQPGDPGALQPELEALAEKVQALMPGWTVRGATLACRRSLSALAGVQLIFPQFMADGWFVRSETPRRLAEAGVEGARLIAPLGLDPEMPVLGAKAARDAARAAGIDPAGATLVVVGHGSKGSRASANSTRAFAEALPGGAGFAHVTTAFIEEAPFLSDVVPQGPAVCLPFFATNGGHTIEDIPQGWHGHGPITPPIGTTGDIPRLIAAALQKAAATAEVAGG